MFGNQFGLLRLVWIQLESFFMLVRKSNLDMMLIIFLGNDNGEVFFWKMGPENIQELAKMVLPVQKQVRKAMLTSDCKYIILTTDDGKLWYLKLDKIPTCE